MASRLTTIIRWYQEIAGSTPAVVIFLFISYLFAIFFLSWDRTTYSMPCLFQIGSIKFDNTLVSGREGAQIDVTSISRSVETWYLRMSLFETTDDIQNLCTILSLTHLRPSYRDGHSCPTTEDLSLPFLFLILLTSSPYFIGRFMCGWYCNELTQ